MTSRFFRRHRRLLTSAAIAAGLMALAIGGSAHAQGVNGTGTFNSGTGSIVNSPNTTTVTTTSNQAIITWRPTDTAPTGGPINFLPNGRAWRFEGTGSYTVLNRFAAIDPFTGLPIPITRQIALAGDITSVDRLTGQRGGNIWFYNAGGLLIGASGVINVGSLVLTANDIDTSGGLFGPGGTIRFRGGAGSSASVRIDAGAQVSAGGTGVGDAYMAVVAPRVVQRGLVDVDGSVAYVAAEQADIRINNGLFDINVIVGANGGTVIDHSGVTTGAAQRDGDGRDSRIYMVAMPKNDAVTMLVAGQVGYRDPETAQVEPNGAIRLAAGYNIFGGELAQNPVNTTPANIVVNDIIFNSGLIARASNNLDAAPVEAIPIAPIAVPPPQQGRLRFNQDAVLIGDNRATLTLGNQQAAVALGNLSLVSGGRQDDKGNVQVRLTHLPFQSGLVPTLTVGRTLLLDASKTVTPFSGGDASAGRAQLIINGGEVSASAITLRANATAGFGTAALGGTGLGGDTELVLNGANSRVDAGTVSLSSNATGGGARENPTLGTVEVALQGGEGRGGTAEARVTGGASLNVSQLLTLNARGTGGTGSVLAGNGSGGTARLMVTGAASRVNSSSTELDTAGRGGSFVQLLNMVTQTAQGGTGTGGISEIETFGTVNLGQTFLGAEGTGGNANSGANRGGDGIGGTANLVVTGGTAQLARLFIDIDGLAGGGSTTNPALVNAIHGVGRGGTALVDANFVPLTINGDVIVTGIGNSLLGPSSGVTTLERSGGSVRFRAINGGTIAVSETIDIDVSAGSGFELGGNETANGNANGGTINLIAESLGELTARSFNLRSNAFTANAVGPIGSASGGTITIDALQGGRLTSRAGENFVSASAVAGSGPIGGQGQGGTISITADDGLVNLGGSSLLEANGTSGLSSSDIPAGPGRGGTVRLESTRGGEIGLGNMVVQVNGQTGEMDEVVSASSGVAGNGQGGSFIIDLQVGSINGSSLTVKANGRGGASLADYRGGDGTGGRIDLNLNSGTLNVDFIDLAANGTGEEGGPNRFGGTGTGGSVTVNMTGGALLADTLLLAAAGKGGDGRLGREPVVGPLQPAGHGGDGRGGTVVFNADSGDVSVGDLRLSANGDGGNGGGFFSSGGGSRGDTGEGGAGVGGTAIFNSRGASTSISQQLVIAARGSGGNGGQLPLSAGQPAVSLGGGGGNGQGGSAEINLEQEINVGSDATVLLDASATGGDGAVGLNDAGGQGGNARGGTVTVSQTAGLQFLFDWQLRASAIGGLGGNGAVGGAATEALAQGGAGGLAEGGQVNVRSSGAGTRLVLQNPIIDVNASGGAGGSSASNGAPLVGGDGGNARGGAINLLADDNGELLIQARQGLSAIGTGGEGGIGSNGRPGDPFDAAADDGADGSNATAPGENGGDGGNGANGETGRSGRDGGTGGQGGLGTGGSITLLARNGGLLDSTVQTLEVTGIGGSGGNGGRGGVGGVGQAGGNGGRGGNGLAPGVGGRGGNGGIGGDGGRGGNGGTGGNGGEGHGGAVLLFADNGRVNAGSVTVNAGGLGGANGNAGEGGAAGQPGAGGLGGAGGTSPAGNGANGSAGAMGNIGTGGDDGFRNFTPIFGRGGTITFRNAGPDSRIFAGNIRLLSNASNANNERAGAGGTIIFDLESPSNNDPAISLGSLEIESLGSEFDPDQVAVDLDAKGAKVEIGGDLNIRAMNRIRIAARGSGGFTVTGTADIYSGAGDIRLEMEDSGTLAVDRNLFLVSGRELRFDHRNRTAGVKTASAGEFISLIGEFGIFANENSEIQAGLDLNAFSFGVIDVGDLAAEDGDLRVTSGLIRMRDGRAAFNIVLTGETIGVTGTLDAAQDIIVNAVDNIAVNAARAGDDIRLTGSTMVLGDLRATGSGPDDEGDGSDFTITATGDVTIDHAEAASDFRATANRFTTGLNSIITGDDIIIDANTTVDLGNSTAGGRIDVAGSQILFNNLSAGTNILLQTRAPVIQGPTAGPLGDGSIGGSQMTAGGRITANALAGITATDVIAGTDAAFTAGGNIALASLRAGGNAQIYGTPATSVITVGPVTAGGFVEARGARLAFGNVTAGTDVILSSFNGGLTVGDVTAGDDIFLTVNGSSANPDAITPDSQTGTASATQFNLVAGNLRSTGLGSDTAASGPRSFTGAGPATNVIRVRASGNVQTGNVTTAGSAILAADLGTVTAGNVAGTDGVGIFVRGNAALGNVTTGGLFWLGDSSQFSGIVPAYRVTNFAPSQTATSGNAVLGNVTAGQIRGTTLGGLTYGSLAATGPLSWTGTNGALSGGTITSGGDMTLSFGGDMLVGTVNGTGQVQLTSANGRIDAPSISGARVEVTAAGDVTLPIVQSPGQVVLGSANGAVRVATNIVAGGGVNADGRSLFLRATGPLQVSNAVARAGDIDIAAAGNLTVGTAIASANITLDAGQDLNVQRFDAGGNGALVARAGDVTLAPASGTAQPGRTTGNLTVRAGNRANLASVTVGGNADIEGVNGVSGTMGVNGSTRLVADRGAVNVTLRSGGLVTASADRITISGDGSPLDFASITTDVGEATIRNTGNVRIRGGTVATQADVAGNDIRIDALTARSLVAAADRNMLLGNLTVNAALRATANAMLGVTGTLAAEEIELRSGDISIDPAARIGVLGTTRTLSLVNIDRTSPTFIGGTGTRAGWHLDAGEITRLFGANIGIEGGRVSGLSSASVGSTRPPDVLVDDFTINSALQFGPSGSFAITTPGKLRAVGDARFTNMADAQSVRITANDALEVILGDGSIVLTDAAGALGGVLRLQSEDVIVATLRAIGDIAVASDVKAINDRLAQNDGITSEQGAIAARGIDVAVTGGFYVQNSGVPGIKGRDFANRRGFTVGAAGLNITTGGATGGGTSGGPVATGPTAGSAPVRIVINGRQIGATGPVSGLDFIPLIRINGVAGATAGLDAASTANGCVIVNVAACRIGPDGFPVQDSVARGAGAGGIGDGRSIAPLVTIRGLDPMSGQPLIDDPVTGAGNEDFWNPGEEEEEED